MVSAAQLRRQVEHALAARSGARLELLPRLVGSGTADDSVDALLREGLPAAGTTEIVGGRSSGRTSLAAAYVAERTREGHVCAWVDVSGEVVPDVALADGVLVDRVLWVRCSGAGEPDARRPEPLRLSQALAVKVGGPSAMHLMACALPGAKPDLRPYNPTRNSIAGTPGAPNRLFQPAAERVEQVNSDRAPARRGRLVVKSTSQKMEKSVDGVVGRLAGSRPSKPAFVVAKKPWGRMEQAMKAVDLLIQGGGFGTVVLDLGSIAPQFARRIPLATWFRWRAAAERARTSLIVISQMGCTGSSAELVLRAELEVPEAGAVLTGIDYRLQVVRRRYAESQAPGKKPPRSAVAWEPRMLLEAL